MTRRFKTCLALGMAALIAAPAYAQTREEMERAMLPAILWFSSKQCNLNPPDRLREISVLMLKGMFGEDGDRMFENLAVSTSNQIAKLSETTRKAYCLGAEFRLEPWKGIQ